MKQYHKNIDDKDHSNIENLDDYLDMDIRMSSSQEAINISQNPFLSRGISETPDVRSSHCSSYSPSACKLSTYDWISAMDITTDYLDFPIAEVRFKNSRKDFFLLPKEGVY